MIKQVNVHQNNPQHVKHVVDLVAVAFLKKIIQDGALIFYINHQFGSKLISKKCIGVYIFVDFLFILI